MAEWKPIVARVATLILLGILAFVLILLIVGLISRNAPCKNSSTCLVDQTCNVGRGVCVSLPGAKCTLNDQCSAYAPICNLRGGRYCTNFSSQGRGTSGNPPNLGSGPRCNPGLTYNSNANLCQETSIGAQCTINAQCNLGVCDTRTRTCQYATTNCNTDTNLNPAQCNPPYECDGPSSTCTIPGTTPGSDGTPCNSSSDCAAGSSCVPGPPGTAFTGICRAGKLSWLMMTPPDAECITPLVGDSGWCRYDIAQFMQCSTLVQCQYPYPTCDGNTLVCKESPTMLVDPIILNGFPYNPVGVNVPTVIVSGAFYIASFPSDPPEADNATGGKLLDSYSGFLTFGSQFQDQPGFNGRQLVTFSRYTSFSVVSFAVAQVPPAPPAPPQLPYQTAIFSDPNPVLAMTAIIPSTATESVLEFSFYRQNYPTLMNLSIGGITFKSSDARIWNPAAVKTFAPSGFPDVAFIPNPIVTPWINVTPSLGGQTQIQISMTHSLMYADGRYYLGFNAFNPDSNINVTQSALLIPCLLTSGVSPLTPYEVLITSWDAISVQSTGLYNFNTTVVLYGLSQATGDYVMYYAQIQFDASRDNFLYPSVTVGGNPSQIPFGPSNIQSRVISRHTQVRLNRTAIYGTEPQLAVSFFYEVVGGLQISTSAVDSATGDFDFDNNSARTADFTLPGVTDLIYVSPVTGAYNYGCFVVWCATTETRSAFLTVQVYATFRTTLTLGVIYSAVYWRRLVSDPLPDNYFVYPIGGGSTPIFLITDKSLTFDGSPELP